jgi:DeoR/GlpR family transcriptional regulator of sugar metabolism
MYVCGYATLSQNITFKHYSSPFLRPCNYAMLPAQRRRSILEIIETNGSSTIADLSQRFNVSEMTIRRDLQTLDEEGSLLRTHGGAIIATGQAAIVEPRYAAKQRLYATEKAAIAQYAADKLVQDGDIIVLEGGTSVTLMAEYLANKRDLTVVTNGLYTTNELRRLLPQAIVICTGGILRDVALTFVGPLAEHFFHEFHANKVFLSATGLTMREGYTDPNMLETQVKKAMLNSADSLIMLVDSSKFGVKSLVTVMRPEQATVLVTDEGAPEATLQELQKEGVDIRIA